MNDGEKLHKTTSRRLLLASLTMLAASSLASSLSHAQECTKVAQDRLGRLDADQIVLLPPPEVKAIQSCLKARGCYASDPKEIDGIVGKYTGAALDRLGGGLCSLNDAEGPTCGNGQDMMSWSLTADDLKKLQTPPAAPAAAGASSGAVGQSGTSTQAVPASAGGEASPGDSSAGPAPVSSAMTVSPASASPSGAAASGGTAPATPQKPAMSDELVRGLQAMQGADYPSSSLFDNALKFIVTGGQKNSELANEWKKYRTKILAQACKAHPSSGSGAAWEVDWNTASMDVLSQPTYGFFPFWLASAAAAPAGDSSAGGDATGSGAGSAASNSAKPAKPLPPIKLDFGIVQRLGWFGVTFSSDGTLDLPDEMYQADSAISEKIQTARRYRTSVDLVVYDRKSRSEWLQVIYGDSQSPAQLGPQEFIAALARNIAKEVGSRRTDLLDRVQRWILPSPLTFPTTTWDGATIYFDGFPYDDQGAMQFLDTFLRTLRNDLAASEAATYGPKASAHMLNLNVVIPYSAFVSEKKSDRVSMLENTADATPSTTSWLAELVPKTRGEDTVGNAAAPGDDDVVVDRFIVFLPQSTSQNKKDLRLEIEDSFNRNTANKDYLKADSTVSLATWRVQMLRRITFVLAPSTWSWKGDYTVEGAQFYDDMLYARNNFSGVGFWPLPAINGADQPLAAQVLQIFHPQGGNYFQTVITPFFVKLLGLRTANFFIGYRREIFVALDLIALILAIFAIAAYWQFAWRQFFFKRKWWFVGVVLAAVAVLSLLCLFDPGLRDWAGRIFLGLAVVAVAALFLWQYFVSNFERDLP